MPVRPLFPSSARLHAVIASMFLLLLLSCHDSPRSNPLDPELTPAVELAAALDDTAGAVTLHWTPYSGRPAFAAYRVLRNVQKSTEVETLAVVDEVTRTTWVDTALTPATAYEYRLETVNTAGLAVASPPQTVAGYAVMKLRLLAVEADSLAGLVRLRWSRYRGPGFGGYQVVRHEVGTAIDTTVCLSPTADDTVAVDSAAWHGVSYTYQVEATAQGQRLASEPVEARLVLPACSLLSPRFDATTASVALAWEPYHGPRFAAYEVRRRTAALAPTVIAATADPAHTAHQDAGLRGNTRYYYQVTVRTTRGEEAAGDEVSGGIYLHAATWPLPHTRLGRSYVRLWSQGADTLTVLSTDLANLTNGNLEVRVRTYSADGEVHRDTVLIGNRPNYFTSAQMQLATETTPDGIRLLALAGNYGLNPVGSLVAYDGSAGGRTLWRRSQDTPGNVWMSLARLEDQVLFAADRRTYTLGPDGVLTPGTDLPGRAGEVRAWPTRRGWAVGACLPEQSQILWGDLPPGWAPDWAASLVTAVGPTLDRLGDPLVYPVSFDAGPDGRLFVVDAGHGRIVVFNTARRYVTQWGEPGSGEGQFNFGLGASLVSGDRDYSGSVAVDTQGRIYVADGFNGRIQIFVP